MQSKKFRLIEKSIEGKIRTLWVDLFFDYNENENKVPKIYVIFNFETAINIFCYGRRRILGKLALDESV